MNPNNAPTHFIKPIISKPGIQRDGTIFDSDCYTDGLWVRFFRNRPKKIGGYQVLSPGTTAKVQGMYNVPIDDNIIYYIGRSTGISSLNVYQGSAYPEMDHTISEFPNNNKYLWVFDTVIKPSANVAYLLNQPIPSAENLNSNSLSSIYWMDTADSNDTTKKVNVLLEKFSDSQVEPVPVQSSGGFVVLPPFLFTYSNNGIIGFAEFNFESNNVISVKEIDYSAPVNRKIVAARVLGGGTPSILFWSLDQLVRAVFVGGNAVFAYIPNKTRISIIAQNSIVEKDGKFFWIGDGEFYISNGESVSILPNVYNKDFFFTNLNRKVANKIVGFVQPLWSEIWWQVPLGDSTENNHVIILNYENGFNNCYFYDTPLDRTFGISSNVLFPYPVMADSKLKTIALVNQGEQQALVPTYPIWQHEFGVDEIVNSQVNAVESYFTTRVITIFEDNPGLDNYIQLLGFEPDIQQVGDLILIISNKTYAAYPTEEQLGGTFIIPDPNIITKLPQAKTDCMVLGRQIRVTVKATGKGVNYYFCKTEAKMGIGPRNQ